MIPRTQDPPYEPVYTITEFHDFPLEGVAAFLGHPHFFRAQRGVFRLWPIDDEAFRLALESWEIYVRWDRALQAGLVSEDEQDHEAPQALPEDIQRYHDLKKLLNMKLAEPPTGVAIARAAFRQLDPWQNGRGWVRFDVAWTPVSESVA